MLAHVELKKTDLGTYGDGWELFINDIENPEMPTVHVRLSEYEGELAAKSFKKVEKSGKWEQDHKYT
jgi:hypothetical protein